MVFRMTARRRPGAWLPWQTGVIKTGFAKLARISHTIGLGMGFRVFGR
jgi:hypothetical protein